MSDPTLPPFPVDAALETPPPTPPPPGTTVTTFWQHSGTKSAVVLTMVLVQAIVRPWVTARFGAEIALGAEAAEWAWLAAAGFDRMDTNSLRRL